MGDDLIETRNYTLSGIQSLESPLASRKQLRERRFDVSGGSAPLPVYHSELDRNLINHFQKAGVRKVLRSRAFQSMLPGIDHELKMEQTPAMAYTDKFTRTMFVGKQGSNTSYAQPPSTGGVRKRMYKDVFSNTQMVDGRLQMPMLEKEADRMTSTPQPACWGRSLSATQELPAQYRIAPHRSALSKVGNTAFGIRNHGGTHESPFFRNLPGGTGGKRQPPAAPTCPDSSRSMDLQMVKDPSHQQAGGVLNKKDYLSVSTKYPPHMQHHHHYGWADAHIGTSLYQPRSAVVQEHRDRFKDRDHAVNYVDKVRSTHSSISKCPTSMISAN